MGVNGLWTVLQPCARPTNLATLNKKRLAVDASIWIYQFLKAVRDKEGNALRNSHVVGFFRRICKLLWFGIKPVFVFDGGAPALKRATLQARRRRREGRREDAVRTAGKLLAVQMQRIAREEEDKHRTKRVRRSDTHDDDGATGNVGTAVDQEVEEILPDASKLVYVEEIGQSEAERQRNRRFYKQDAYHLPELDGSIDSMGKPEDPRIMSVAELEEYARQFHAGEDINLYDFSKIDFDGEFFKSLPAADRYNILNAARLRSRLRMGLSKNQLDEMFPDRMAFSRFQIERVKERNHLTQRLMFEAGMTGTDWTVSGTNQRVAGERNREYILVKNEGAEGGWALGVVSRDEGRGEVQNPIDIDRLDFQYQRMDDGEDDEDDEGFEDVPIEGLNRLPRLKGNAALEAAQEASAARRALYQARLAAGQVPEPEEEEEDDSMFVGGGDGRDDLFGDATEPASPGADEDEDLTRAIAMSLEKQHGIKDGVIIAEGAEADEEEDGEAPQWSQKAVAAPKPISKASGRMVAHMVNNRANAAVPKPRRTSDPSSDSDMDLNAALAAARKKKIQPKAPAPIEKMAAERAPIRPNVKKAWDGPLPFEKLDWQKSIFAQTKPSTEAEPSKQGENGALEPQSDEELEGGFERSTPPPRDAPLPLPPWLKTGEEQGDIREEVQKQQKRDQEMNHEDYILAEQEEQVRRRKHRDAVIRIDSEDEEDAENDSDSDVEIVDAPSPKLVPKQPSAAPAAAPRMSESVTAENPKTVDSRQQAREEPATEEPEEPETPNGTEMVGADGIADMKIREESPDMEFEDVALPNDAPAPTETRQDTDLREPDLELPDSTPPPAQQIRTEGIAEPITSADAPEGELFADEEFDISDPEEEELLASLAAEASEHARFASTLNNKTEAENQEAYERELRALRNQQKKDRRDADEVTQIMVTECQSLLRLFGIPYVTAPMEAEAQCAELIRLGLVDGIVTDDSDCFLFGGTRIYKNMFNGNKFVELFLAADLDKELSLGREQLVSLALLLGSDYTEGLGGVGPVTAVEIISEFPGVDGLAAFRDWWQDIQLHNRPKEADAGSSFRRKFRKAHATKLFLPPGFPSPAVADAYIHPQVDSDPQAFQWGVPNLEGLRQFLMATIGWSQERTDEVLVPVIKDMNKREAEGTQSNITHFFEGGVGTGAKEAFAPRRTAKGSKRMLEAVGKLRTKAGGGDQIAGDAPEVGEDREVGEKEAVNGEKPRKRRRKARKAASTMLDDEDADLEE